MRLLWIPAPCLSALSVAESISLYVEIETSFWVTRKDANDPTSQTQSTAAAAKEVPIRNATIAAKRVIAPSTVPRKERGILPVRLRGRRGKSVLNIFILIPRRKVAEIN